MTTNTNNQSVSLNLVSRYLTENHRKLLSAQKKLTQQDVPMSLRAIYYLRVCTNVMCRTVQSTNTISKSITNSTSYSTLLGFLQSEDLLWWNTCYISDTGLLFSHNLRIQKLLQPVNLFVQMMVDNNDYSERRY